MAQLFARRLVDPQRHIRVNALAFDIVGIADDGCLGNLRVRDQRTLDLGGAESVAGDVDHVVDPPGNPVITILIPARAVAGKIKIVKGRKVGVDKAAMVAIDRAHLPGP